MYLPATTHAFWRGLIVSLLIGTSLQAAITPRADLEIFNNNNNNNNNNNLEARGGPHCTIFSFTIPPPRYNAANRRDITDTVNNNQRRNGITFANTAIRVDVQAVSSPYGHLINLTWQNYIEAGWTVLLLGFRADQNPLTDPPARTVEIQLAPGEPGPFTDTPSTRRTCHDVADGYKWALQIRGPT